VLLVVFVDQDVGLDVSHGKVVLGVVRPFPHIDGGVGIDHDAIAQSGPDPPRGRLHVVHRDD
jgi:hypothetical protein